MTSIAPQPNPPVWPDTVLVFDPSMEAAVIEERITKATGVLTTPEGHFSTKRLALLFKPGKDAPGTYNINVEVGYYTQVLGLGRKPDDVIFSGEGNKLGVHCRAADPEKAGSLDTFWRSVENIKHAAFLPRANEKEQHKPGMMWAVSQGEGLFHHLMYLSLHYP